MSAVPLHEAHRRNRAKNVALSAALLAWVVLIFVVSLVKFGAFK